MLLVIQKQFSYIHNKEKNNHFFGTLSRSICVATADSKPTRQILF